MSARQSAQDTQDDFRPAEVMSHSRGYLYQVRHRAKHPERVAARYAVRQALKSGALRRGRCHCGSETTEAHHAEGYGAPHQLSVEWLCRPHHLVVHLGGQTPKQQHHAAYMRMWRKRKKDETS